MDLFRNSKGKIIKCSGMSKKYAEFDLEEIVYKQLENLNAMHDL